VASEDFPLEGDENDYERFIAEEEHKKRQFQQQLQSEGVEFKVG
jgi:hypothetical protein